MKLTLLIIVALLSATSVFAQGGHGVSGPDTQGSRVNLDEKLLTRSEFRSILQGCIETELLDLASTLGKDPNITIRFYRIGSPLQLCDGLTAPRLGENGTIKGCVNFFYSSYFNGNTAYASVGNNDGDLNRYRFNFQLANPSLDLYLVTEDGTGTMQYYENALPGSYDEYGNIVDSKVVVTPLGFKKSDGSPVDSTKSLQLYNASTQQPVAGVAFNFPRYMSCVNLQLGKYTPVSNSK